MRQDGVLTESYAYDANGNRTSATAAAGPVAASYDAQDRLAQYGAATFTHTPNGERLSKSLGGQTTTYRYDGLGRMVGVTLPSGTQIDYVLDGAQRRVGKRVNGTLMQGFLYQDSLRPIAELDSAGNVVSRFVYAGGLAPAYLTRGGATYRIISDQLGSPRLVVDVATGAVAQRLDYDTFGNVAQDTNPGFQPFGFAGGLYDRDTGAVAALENGLCDAEQALERLGGGGGGGGVGGGGVGGGGGVAQTLQGIGQVARPNLSAPTSPMCNVVGNTYSAIMARWVNTGVSLRRNGMSCYAHSSQ